MAGVSGVKPIVQIASGAIQMVRLPHEAYSNPRDGQVLKAVSRSTASLAKTGATEALRFSARFANRTQKLFEKADRALGADDSAPDFSHGERTAAGQRRHISGFSEQPQDVWQGSHQAYTALTNNLSKAAHNVLSIPVHMQEAAPSVSFFCCLKQRRRRLTDCQTSARNLGRAMLYPVIGVTAAAAKLSLGGLNSLDPTERLRDEDERKYKKR